MADIFLDYILVCIFVIEKFSISIQIQQKFVCAVLIDNKSTLIHVMDPSVRVTIT